MTFKSILAGIALSVLGTAAIAADFPTKPITLVVPYPPGGNVDVSTRILQKALGDSLGQPIVVENRPGGGGMIAGAYVAKADPDGHTLFVGSNGPVLFGPMTSENATYTWQDAFQPVSSLALATNVLLVRKDFPAQTPAEFIAYAKEHPGEILVGVSSLVSINHFLGLLLQQKAGAEWTEVVYNGNAPAVTDLVAGQIDAGFQQLVSSKQHIESGAIRPIAIVGTDRSPLLPDVPTLIESGFSNVAGVTFNGVFAPKGTPDEIVELLSGKIREALKDPEAVEKFAGLGSVTGGSTPQEFYDLLSGETAKWKEVMAASGE